MSDSNSSVPAAAIDGGGVTGQAFHHPERDAAGTEWEPIDTYPDGEAVMLDDGERQIFGRREMGLWMQLVAGDELAQPDYRPMLWAWAPERIVYDMI